MTPAKGWRGSAYDAVRKAHEAGELKGRGSNTRLAEKLGLSRVRVGQLLRQVIADEKKMKREKAKR